jgi:hypothetical protein
VSIHGERHQAQSGRTSGFGGFLFGVEVADEVRLALDHDLNCPPPDSFIPDNISMPRTGVPISGLVLSVFEPRQHPQIGTAVIPPIAVDVVAFSGVSSLQPKKLPMEKDGFSVPIDPRPASSVTSSRHAPCPLVDPFRIGRINDGVRLDRTITGAQRDTYGILIGHRLSPSGGVAAPADLTIGAGLSCDNYAIFGGA